MMEMKTFLAGLHHPVVADGDGDAVVGIEQENIHNNETLLKSIPPVPEWLSWANDPRIDAPFPSCSNETKGKSCPKLYLFTDLNCMHVLHHGARWHLVRGKLQASCHIHRSRTYSLPSNNLQMLSRWW